MASSEKCKECRFSAWVYTGDGEITRCCDYLLRVGKSRPCPAGDECTVFEPKTDQKEKLLF